MERDDRRRAVWLGLALFAALAPGAFFGLPGKSVAGAWRVLQGEQPYRDFWSMYAPGQFYTVACVLAATGRHVLVPALVACALRAATAALLYSSARRFGAPSKAALAASAVLGLSQFEHAPELSSYPAASFLISWALLLVASYANGGGRAALTRAGLLLGCAAFYKHDVAGYATLGFALGLEVAGRVVPDRPAAWLGAGKAALALALPAAAVVAVLAAALAMLAGRAALEDLILFPLGDFPIVRGEPYPGLLPNPALWQRWLDAPSDLARARDAVEVLAEWMLGNAPQYAFVALAIALARSRTRLAPAAVAGSCALLASLPFFWWAAHTQQNTHFTSMAVGSLLTAALVAPTLATRGARVASLTLALFYCAGLAIRPAMELYLPLRVWSEPVALGLPAAEGLFVSPRERDVYRAVRDFVESRVAPDEPVYLGVARHDAIVINNPRFVWLLDRPSATRYHELHPGITDRADVQREMIADLERRRVRCAVIWRFGWDAATLDGIVRRRRERLPELGATALDEYLAANFRPVLERGEYVVLWRDLDRAGAQRR